MQVVSLTNQGPVLVPRQMKGDASSTVCDMRKLYSLATSHSTSPLDALVLHNTRLSTNSSSP
jgi:hypothetical protein